MPDKEKLRLGVNIDHVATLRNARGGDHPPPLRAAELVARAGADGITAHLREDRRHIRDDDITRLMQANILPLNLEMAATDEMQAIALHHKPHSCCIVPEKRQELTTEGGLDVEAGGKSLQSFIARLQDADIHVSLFIDPDALQIAAAADIGAAIIELHTGAFCEAVNHGDTKRQDAEHIRLTEAAELAAAKGLAVHAGHGLGFASVQAVAAIPQMRELNIGHFLIGEAVFSGLEAAIREMRRLMDAARSTQKGAYK